MSEYLNLLNQSLRQRVFIIHTWFSELEVVRQGRHVLYKVVGILPVTHPILYVKVRVVQVTGLAIVFLNRGACSTDGVGWGSSLTGL